VPFDFLKRGKAEPASGAMSAGPAGAVRPTGGVAFDGLTEDWRLVGSMQISGRLSDVLNRRETIAIADVSWAPIDGSEPLTPVPGLQSIDPYDLIIVLAGEGSLPLFTDEERAARKVHKVCYEVALDLPPFRVIGTIYLHPGSDPERLLERATDMFVPVTEAAAFLGDDRIEGLNVDAILINRSYLRGVQQIDMRTGVAHSTLPGASMGGVDLDDRPG
jgi:hypothetical protein